MNIKSAYIIAGPTASGKSDFAHKLAKRIHGAIINCDSVQIYHGIENISASPFAGRKFSDEIDGVPYRLFSILPLSEQISVAEYIALARREYDIVCANGYVPIFVGGTGYYINGIVNGIAQIPEISAENRARARDMVAKNLEMARAMVAETGATDSQRVARALEVFFQTGRHITEWWNEPRIGAILPTPFKILINPSMDVLRKRIAGRIPCMLAGGAIDEAKYIIDNNLDSSRAIGAGQLCDYITGKITRDVAIENWITKTNQYAKRQKTWFKTQMVADTVIDHIPTSDDLIAG
ncbi:MAG: tRNA (adenosine(37)-N6)-dimethylallyltransferase MiaA [Alphaproteobacteria bacterium]|nr:tRNA (adenosine(37)-N6)-dimethylallyltransferase MiaA [Alphaproteobacteria bacterium]